MSNVYAIMSEEKLPYHILHVYIQCGKDGIHLSRLMIAEATMSITPNT